MNKYLSHGMGVNSTALMLLLIDEGIEFKSIFMNHGGDYPESYEYSKYLVDEGYEIIEVKPDVLDKKANKRFDDIYDFYFSIKSLPSFKWRHCTYKFKLKPFYDYIEYPAIVYIGYDSEERSRAWGKKRFRKGITYEYPLIEYNISRLGCEAIIRSHGLKVPRKSSCYFCPFQNKFEWKELSVNHPDLFKKVMNLEKNANSYLLGSGKRVSSLWQENKITNYVGSEK